MPPASLLLRSSAPAHARLSEMSSPFTASVLFRAPVDSSNGDDARNCSRVRMWILRGSSLLANRLPISSDGQLRIKRSSWASISLRVSDGIRTNASRYDSAGADQKQKKQNGRVDVDRQWRGVHCHRAWQSRISSSSSRPHQRRSTLRSSEQPAPPQLRDVIAAEQIPTATRFWRSLMIQLIRVAPDALQEQCFCSV